MPKVVYPGPDGDGVWLETDVSAAPVFFPTGEAIEVPADLAESLIAQGWQRPDSKAKER